MEIVTVDIGGTHARFALARVGSGAMPAVQPALTLKTADHASFAGAWRTFARHVGRPLPANAAIAVAAPATGDVIRLTNNPWALRRADLAAGLDRLTIVNDFGAIGHAVTQLSPVHFAYVCGPERPFGDRDTISIVGPGTGLGVAHVVGTASGPLVIEGEGGHVDFAPLDPFEDAMLANLRMNHRRVSVERIASGPGLANIYEALTLLDGTPVRRVDDKSLWTSALDGSDPLAVAAFDRFCRSLGSIAGDIALAQGGTAVAIAGGLGLRLAGRLADSGFADRFCAKGRFEGLMQNIPVKVLTHPEPGLIGAAAAFAKQHLPQ